MLPLFKVHTPAGVAEKVAEVWSSGFVTEGEYSDKFESMFGEYVQNSNTSLVNSCTSALALTSRMCDVGPGDEVITTPMTCMATNEPYFNDGAKLVKNIKCITIIEICIYNFDRNVILIYEYFFIYFPFVISEYCILHRLYD